MSETKWDEAWVRSNRQTYGTPIHGIQIYSNRKPPTIQDINYSVKRFDELQAKQAIETLTRLGYTVSPPTPRGPNHATTIAEVAPKAEAAPAKDLADVSTMRRTRPH